MTEIYLIRHTQAEGNRYRMLQGFWDGDVTERGRKQNEALAERFRNIPLDAVYSSDLSRAVLTAEAAARWHALPVQTRTGLRELNIGPWEQKFFGNVCWETPELTERFLFDSESWRLEGAETFRDVRDRALRTLTELARENEGRNIAVVSHGVTIRCLMWAITGIPLSDVKRLPIFKNTAVTKLLWNGERFTIEYMNDASHLPPELQSSWNTNGDLRDVPYRPAEDSAYYERCYADAWRFAHGNLNLFHPGPYLDSARRHVSVGSGSVLRIYLGEEAVGLVDLDPDHGAEDGIGWISLLYLKESYRSRGYGIQLLARAIFFYRALGRDRLQLHVAEENRIARAFYEREGFRVIGEQRAATGKLLLMEWNRNQQKTNQPEN